MSVESVRVLWKSDLTVGFTTTVVIVSLKPNFVGFVLSNPQHFRETTVIPAAMEAGVDPHGASCIPTVADYSHCQVLGDGLLLRLSVTASMEKAVRSTVQQLRTD
jgi:hypothetical protein